MSNARCDIAVRPKSPPVGQLYPWSAYHRECSLRGKLPQLEVWLIWLLKEPQSCLDPFNFKSFNARLIKYIIEDNSPLSLLSWINKQMSLRHLKRISC